MQPREKRLISLLADCPMRSLSIPPIGEKIISAPVLIAAVKSLCKRNALIMGIRQIWIEIRNHRSDQKIAQGEDCQIPGDRQFGRMSQEAEILPDPFALFLILHVRNQEEDRCGDQDAQYAVNDISDFETVGIISQRIGDNGQYHVLQHQGHDGVCNIGHSKEPALCSSSPPSILMIFK